MRIIVHDYSGHPFQVQLSRWLAAQGHKVQHLYSADIQTPHGCLERMASDPQEFSISPITTGRSLAKYNFVKRVGDEHRYAKVLEQHIRDFRPDAVLCSNTPPNILRSALNVSHASGARFVTWVQDLYSEAFKSLAAKKFGSLAGPASWYVRRVEFSAIATSDAVVVITQDFAPILEAAGVDASLINVIENWAPLDEITPRPRDNLWAVEQGLQDKFVFLYSGTLGLKHEPSLLSRMAEDFLDRPEVRVVVISEGLGRQFLEEEKAAKNLRNLLLFDFVPYDSLPDALASADVLVAILEPSAGVLSVPSKILSYICAGRPILAAIPSNNLAAETIRRSGAGLLADPTDFESFLSQAKAHYDDPVDREARGKLASEYAQKNFDISNIGPRILKILSPT